MKYGIDVCSYQGVIDWKRVKKAGCSFAVLKCIRKDLNPDTAFSRNVAGCREHGIPISCYTYVYEASKVGAEKRARAAVAALKAQKLTGVTLWWDVEDDSIRKVSASRKTALTDSIKAARKIVTAAGYGFGIYCDLDFRAACLYAEKLGGRWWIAKYGRNPVTSFGSKPSAAKPVIKGELCGWQYCSKGRISGVSGAVDLDVAYDGDFGGLQTTAPGKPKSPYTLQRLTVANADGANLRELPSGESAVAATAQKGTELAVVEDWTATNTAGGSTTKYVCVLHQGRYLWCAERLLE